jgi:hypothetical protein
MPRGRGGSGANWDDPAGGWEPQGGSGADWGYDDGEAQYGRPAGRYRGPADDYAGVDLDRAIVPSVGLAPAEVGVPGMPGMPGIPSEEDERLLGIRRPVYIPATGNKRRRRIGSWRVISGVLSVVLMCVAACGAATVLGRHYVSSLYGKVVPTSPVANIDYTPVPATPVATPGSAGVQGGGTGEKYVVSVTTSKRWDPTGSAVDVTSHFLVNDVVYVVAQIRNAPQGQHTACVRWYLNGVYLVLPQSSEVCTAVTNPNVAVEFSLPFPQPGVGMARIYWDRPAKDTDTSNKDPYLAQTILFGIYEPATPTAVPGKTPSPSPGKTPTATPKNASTGWPEVAWVANRRDT